MKVFNKSSFLVFLFTITFSIPSNAVIDYKPDTDKKTTIVKKHKKAKKKGFFKRWKEKFFLKKLKKLQKKIDKTSINKKANASLILGVGSVLMLAAALLTGFIGSAVTFIFFGVAGLSAIIGDFISFSILKKTKEEKEKYRKERKKTKWGFTLSLLVGLIPLIALLIALLAFS